MVDYFACLHGSANASFESSHDWTVRRSLEKSNKISCPCSGAAKLSPKKMSSSMYSRSTYESRRPYRRIRARASLDHVSRDSCCDSGGASEVVEFSVVDGAAPVVDCSPGAAGGGDLVGVEAIHMKVVDGGCGAGGLNMVHDGAAVGTGQSVAGLQVADGGSAAFCDLEGVFGGGLDGAVVGGDPPCGHMPVSIRRHGLARLVLIGVGVPGLDLVAGPDLLDGCVGAVGHQDRGAGGGAGDA